MLISVSRLQNRCAEQLTRVIVAVKLLRFAVSETGVMAYFYHAEHLQARSGCQGRKFRVWGWKKNQE